MRAPDPDHAISRLVEDRGDGQRPKAHAFGDINNARQNHVELVADDLWKSHHVPRGWTRRVLKWRGVSKWLAVRRMLITLKHRWKARIKEVHEERKAAKAAGDMRRYHRLAGYEKGLTEARAQVRALCHSARDVDWPIHRKEWPEDSVLPEDFPDRPGKRWLAHRRGKVAS